MANKSVYLAGPITGLTFDDATDWRNHARDALAKHGIEGLSPLRGKAYLKTLGQLSAGSLAEGKAGILSKPRAIMVRDFRDATTCGALLVNLLGATRVSIGTVMEIAWAYQIHTPIVCCMEPEGNVHDHAMITEAIGIRCTSLEQGLAVCVSILNPNPGTV